LFLFSKLTLSLALAGDVAISGVSYTAFMYANMPGRTSSAVGIICNGGSAREVRGKGKIWGRRGMKKGKGGTWAQEGERDVRGAEGQGRKVRREGRDTDKGGRRGREVRTAYLISR
jgi:hypothetical protein